MHTGFLTFMSQSADTITFLYVIIELITAEMIAAVCFSYIAGLSGLYHVRSPWSWSKRGSCSCNNVEVLREQATAVESKVCAAVDNEIKFFFKKDHWVLLTDERELFWQCGDLWRLLQDLTCRLENHQSKRGDLCRLILAKSHSSDSQVDPEERERERERDGDLIVPHWWPWWWVIRMRAMFCAIFRI